jgi:hypothetical protein
VSGQITSPTAPGEFKTPPVNPLVIVAGFFEENGVLPIAGISTETRAGLMEAGQRNSQCESGRGCCWCFGVLVNPGAVENIGVGRDSQERRRCRGRRLWEGRCLSSGRQWSQWEA